MLYDSASGRWFASISDVTARKVDVAVSDSSDSTGKWHVYAFGSRVSGSLLDQPLLSVTLDKVVISANDYDVFGRFVGSEFWVVDKSAVVAGTTTSYIEFGPYVNHLTIYPAINFGSSSNQYMVSVDQGLCTLFSIVGTPSSLVTVVNVTRPINNFLPPVNGIQLGTTRTIDVSDGRVLSAVWYGSKLWFAFADSTISNGENDF